MEFTAFPKIARFHRTVVVTEKIDGTNAQINIVHSLSPEPGALAHKSLGDAGDLSMFAGSRSRLITPEADNFGFARWVKENAEMLFRLGPGRHYGEWWGNGIQRGYGLPKDDKRLSLFNVHRWKDGLPEGVPCSVVPVLEQRTLDALDINEVLKNLSLGGSIASPGFMKPEGIVIFHTASSTLYKITLDGDGHKDAR